MYRYQIIGSADGEDDNIVIVSSEGETRTLNSEHPNYEKVLRALSEGDFTNINYDEFDDDAAAEEAWLFEQADHALASAANGLTRLSERIIFDGSNILFDGDVIDNSLSRHLLRLVRAGDEVSSIALFIENLALNPSATSRRRLFRWMQDRDFTLTDDGLIVGYKGVQDDIENRSITFGRETVFVDGVAHVGNIPNPVGAVVEMARGLVDPDINNTCSVGLHVGTHEYASDFGQKVLTVLVNPRDVVEVPTDCNGQKIRTCRYVVLDEETKYLDVATAHTTEKYVTRGSDIWDDDQDFTY